MMCEVVGEKLLRDFVSSSLLFLKQLIRPKIPARPWKLHDEDYANDTAIVAHPTNAALIDQSQDTHRMISTVTEFHEMMHNNNPEAINDYQSSLLRGCSVAIDETTPTSFIPPTSDSQNNCTKKKGLTCVLKE